MGDTAGTATGDALETWLGTIVSGAGAMSQRNLRWADAQGGLARVVDAARARGVHLVRLTDDRGRELLAASLHPFETLC